MERFLKSKLDNGRFVGVSPQRSRIMSAIRGKHNKSTEIALRMAFVRSGIKGWVLHPSEICGKPDFYFPKERLAIFVDGCFWHGCPRCGHVPNTRSDFWKAKIQRNQQRDKLNRKMLTTNGIRIIRVWEHALRLPNQVRSVLFKIRRFQDHP